MPAPAVGAMPAGRLALNGECVRCHEGHAADWRDSLHARAWTDADFQHGYAREPDAFCRGCHAPEADPSRSDPGDAGRVGVACVTCHVPARAGWPAGATLAAGDGRGRDAESPHSIVRDPAFGTEAACASCHEFAFPDAPSLAMQATIAEHATAPDADGCASCHMPRIPDEVGTRRGHAFAASRDPQMLRDAVTVAVRRPTAEHLEITLRPNRLGHAFPTGDMFRRLVVDVEVVDDELPIAGDRRVLSRQIEVVRDGVQTRRRQIADTRVMATQATVLSLDLTGAGNRPAHWRVVYERADLRTSDAPARVFGRQILFEGWQSVEP